MDVKSSLLAAACALALAACSDNSSSPTAPESAPTPSATTTPAEAPVTMAPAPAVTAGNMAAAPAAAMDTSKGMAVVTDCATEIEGSDAMQYNVSSIVVPSSCKDFKITLKHTGTMPVTAMGHDVVVTKQSDLQAVDADGMAAGAASGYVKADDPHDPPPVKRAFFSTKEIFAKALEIKADRIDGNKVMETRVGNCMRALGFGRYRVKTGQRERGYLRDGCEYGKPVPDTPKKPPVVPTARGRLTVTGR